LLARLAPHAPSFAFSVYSHDAATHDAVTRTPGSHARTVRAIARTLERGLRVRAAGVLMESTADDLPDLIAFLRALGVERVDAARMRAVGRGDAFDGGSLDALGGEGG